MADMKIIRKHTFNDGARILMSMPLGIYQIFLYDVDGYETHLWSYYTVTDARKAFNNIINSYPDIKVN